MNTTRNAHAVTSDGIVIAGGGLAGQRCAETLRREGYERPIRMVCAEPHRPYDRPPLSKDVLAGADSESSLPYRSEDWYAGSRIDLLLGVAAVELDPLSRRLWLSNGHRLHYEQLLIATGARPRALPALAGYENVSVLRTVDDALALRDVLGSGPRLAVIGAGFIGLEIAATARRLGAEVTLVEAASAPLAGILGSELGAWFGRLHADEGVQVLTGRTVTAVHGDRVARTLELSDGTVVELDHAVVGVGSSPDVAWLQGSGLDTDAGIPVDAHGRTAIDGVFAAGDAAATFEPRLGRHVMGSHWEAAARQGARAARLMLGLAPANVPLTGFWTDQYGLRIQYLGEARLADAVAIDGVPESRCFAATFTQAGRAVAALLVDRPRSLPAARQTIERGQR